MSKRKKKKTIEELLEESLVQESKDSCKENWALVRLGSVCDFKRGPFGSAIKKSMFVPKGEATFKVYEQGNAIRKTMSYGNYYISKEDFDNLKGFDVREDDIIISCAGTIGETYVIPPEYERGIINQALMRVTLSKVLDIRYFLYAFDYYIKQLAINNGKGTAMKNLPRLSELKQYSIALPPIKEQKRIADKVDQLLYKIDEAKRLIEEAKESFEIQEAAILDKAFRGELFNKYNKNRTKNENKNEIDNIPYLLPLGWKWVPLEQIVEFENGDRSSAYPKTKELVNDGIPFLSTRELKGNEIKFDDAKFITNDKFNSLRSGKLKENDILMSIRGSVGKVGLFKSTNDYETGFINAQLVILRSAETIIPRYLLAYFSSRIFKNLLDDVVTGSAQPQLSVKSLKSVLCPLPPIEVQKIIIDKVDNIINKMEIEKSKLSIINLEQLKNSILSKAFRGELGTNDPTEESAIELLKEVLQEK